MEKISKVSELKNQLRQCNVIALIVMGRNPATGNLTHDVITSVHERGKDPWIEIETLLKRMHDDPWRFDFVEIVVLTKDNLSRVLSVMHTRNKTLSYELAFSILDRMEGMERSMEHFAIRQIDNRGVPSNKQVEKFIKDVMNLKVNGDDVDGTKQLDLGVFDQKLNLINKEVPQNMEDYVFSKDPEFLVFRLKKSTQSFEIICVVEAREFAANKQLNTRTSPIEVLSFIWAWER